MADTASFDNRAVKALDRALSGAGSPGDPAVARLVEVAERFRGGIAADSPDFRVERAAFVQAAVERRKTWSWVRFFGPATVTAIALLVAIMVGRSALPGETFYPVRQVLRAVGLAPFSLTEIDAEIDRAKKLLVEAAVLKNRDLEGAREAAFEAVKVLGFTEEILGEVHDQGSGREAQVRALLKRAQGILLLDEKERSRGDRQAGERGPDAGSKNDSPKDDPPGNSGTVRNDDRDDRNGKSKKPEERDERGRSADKRKDGGGSSGSNGGSRSGSGATQDDDDDDDEGDDDADDGNQGRGNDDKEKKDDDDDDDGVTPSPEETVDEVARGLRDEVRKTHGKGPRDDQDDRDEDDDEGDD